MKFSLDKIPGMRVTVMGLGLHGGGAASARFFFEHGARVTVTDLRSEKELSSSLEELSDLRIRYVLGKHEDEDFRSADLVIKNPGVPSDSPYLRMGGPVETDISVFLQAAAAPILAVTGTKGKSTVVSALHHILTGTFPEARLGGNITVSPLSFLDELLRLDPPPPVVLELSSWQLADLRGRNVFRPAVAAITNIMRDHLNRYPSMDAYVEDKKEIYRGQSERETSVFFYDDPWTETFISETKARVLYYGNTTLPDGLEGGWISPLGEGAVRMRDEGKEGKLLVPAELKVPGAHNRLNMLCAAVMARAYGVKDKIITARCKTFAGIPHRLEFVGEKNGVRFYNDSAATIPDAVLEAVRSFPPKVILITGGTDKNLEFSLFGEITDLCSTVVLLEGSGTDLIIEVLKEKGRRYLGPYKTLKEACSTAFDAAGEGDTVLFSPGCASFEMFANEFERGRMFKETVRKFA